MAEPPTIQELLGGFVITISLALILYGVTCAQTYVYMLNSRDDPKTLKLVVWGVMLLETVHTGFAIDMFYHYTITSFGSIEDVATIVWSAGASVVMQMLIVILVQGFYLRRVWILSHRSPVLTGLIGVLLVVRVAFGFATSGFCFTLQTWPQFRQTVGPLFTLSCGLGLSAALDLFIALTLMFYLHRSQTGFKNTDNIIRGLMAYVVNTGAITMTVSIAIVLTFVFLKSSLVFAGLVVLAGKLYSNSFLGTLNARSVYQSKSRSTGPHGYNAAELSNIQSGPSAPVRLGKQIEIFQETSKVTDTQSIGDESRISSKHDVVLPR